MSTETINRQIAGHVSQASVEEFAVQATEALLQEGATALRSEDFEKALHLFGRLSEEVGGSFQIELGKVLAFNGLGQWEQSIRTLTGMLGTGDDEMVLLSIGMAQERLEQYEDALETYKQVIERWPDDGDAWVYRCPPLVSLGRLQDAMDSLEKAYPLRQKCSHSGIWSLYYCSAFLLLLLGVSSIEKRSLPDLETITKGFIMWREQARLDNQAAAFREGEAAAKEMLATEKTESYEEFILSVRLGSIEDPFDRWKALSEEITKRWPKGISAVEAIREQRG